MAKKFVKICPKCNSTDISTDFSNPAFVAGGLFNNAKVCNKCGHHSNFFPEVEVDKLPKVKKIKKDEKVNQVNPNYFQDINWFWRFAGPFGILIGLLFMIFYNIKFIFYLGVLGILPLSIVITFTSYRQDILKKHPLIRIFCRIIYFLTLFVVPAVLVYIYL